jgi:hypothetical protein
MVVDDDMSLDSCKACGNVAFSGQFCSYCFEMHEELRCWPKRGLLMLRESKDKKSRRWPAEGKNRLKTEREPSKVEESVSLRAAESKQEAARQLSGSLSLLQSTYGHRGNFELVVPVTSGGLAHFTRDNDWDDLPWTGPVRFGASGGIFRGASLIQSNFGTKGNLEVMAVDLDGRSLSHLWRDSGPFSVWHEPIRISKKSLVPVFSGSPALIRGSAGHRGNFEVVAPRIKGGFAHYWRDNDDPELSWHGPFEFAVNDGIFDAVALIQSNFGAAGNLEMVARSGDGLAFYWRDSSEQSGWVGPKIIAEGVAGNPSMIQSTFGRRGNFEVVVPLATDGLAHFWRDNDDQELPWKGPFTFGTNAGHVESVALIQSNFGMPGHLELAALANGKLSFFWRDSGPDFRWNGPFVVRSTPLIR